MLDLFDRNIAIVANRKANTIEYIIVINLVPIYTYLPTYVSVYQPTYMNKKIYNNDKNTKYKATSCRAKCKPFADIPTRRIVIYN